MGAGIWPPLVQCLQANSLAGLSNELADNLPEVQFPTFSRMLLSAKLRLVVSRLGAIFSGQPDRTRAM